MSKATINDVKLFLDDLIDGEKRRRENLLLLSSGAIYLGQFTKKRQEIDGLPPYITRALPLASELRGQDTTHDDCGRAFWYFAEAYKNLPPWLCPPEIVEVVENARSLCIPVLSELQAAHSDEAARAAKRRPALNAMKEALSAIPIAGGKSLFDVGSAMLDAGENIGKLLSERASQTTASAEKEGRQRVIVLLSDTLGLIRKCRDQALVELAENSQLPSNLDSLIFDYFDLLVQQRDKASKLEDAPTPIPTPAPAPTTEPGKD